MLRHVSKVSGISSLQIWYIPFEQFRGIGSSSRHSNDHLESEYSQARAWISGFNRDTIPKSIVSSRFDRSSGKGGQHVNTTSSKATCTWTLQAMEKHVPSIIIKELRSARYYVPNSDSLVISSQEGRNQRDNLDDCHEKLYNLLRDIYKRAIPGETSPEQKKRVEQLQKAENAARMKMKKAHSEKKKSRKGGSKGGSDY